MTENDLKVVQAAASGVLAGIVVSTVINRRNRKKAQADRAKALELSKLFIEFHEWISDSEVTEEGLPEFWAEYNNRLTFINMAVHS